MQRVDINKGIATLMGWPTTVIGDSVFLEHPVKNYGFGYQHNFDVLDGSLGSKALCLDLLERFSVTYHPKRKDTPYRYGSNGPYARCGSHEPVMDDTPEKAICVAVLRVHAISDHVAPDTEGIYLQGRDLFVSADQYGLSLHHQCGDVFILSADAEGLTLDAVGRPGADRPGTSRCHFVRSGSDFVLSVEGVNTEQFRLSSADASSLIEFIRSVAPQVWKNVLTHLERGIHS